MSRRGCGLGLPKDGPDPIYDHSRPEGKDYAIHRLLLGTHTSEGEQNYLQVAEVYLPTEGANYDVDAESGGYGGNEARLKITHRINHDGEVNRARYMPQNPNMVATKTNGGPVYVFDLTRHSLQPKPDGVCDPEIKLMGQEKEGYVILYSMGNIRSAEARPFQLRSRMEHDQARFNSQRFGRHDGLLVGRDGLHEGATGIAASLHVPRPHWRGGRRGVARFARQFIRFGRR